MQLNDSIEEKNHIFLPKQEAERKIIFLQFLWNPSARGKYMEDEKATFLVSILCGRVWNNAFKLKRKRKVLIS